VWSAYARLFYVHRLSQFMTRKVTPMKLFSMLSGLLCGSSARCVRKTSAQKRTPLGSIEELEVRRVLARATVSFLPIAGESVFEGSQVAVAGFLSKGQVIGLEFGAIPGTQPRFVDARLDVLIKGQRVTVAVDENPDDPIRFTITRKALGAKNFRALKQTGGVISATVQGSTPGEFVGYTINTIATKMGVQLQVNEAPPTIYTIVSPS